MMNETAEAASKGASAVMYGGAGMSAGSGASLGVTKYLGLAVDEWQVLGVAIGIALGVAGWLTNFVFQWLRYRRGH